MNTEASKRSRTLILSGRYPETEFVSKVNHKAYAKKHGYTFINCDWPTEATNPYLNKFFYIKEYIDNFDYIFWIDDDAFFIDQEKSLEEFIPRDGNIISICRSPTNKHIFTYVSSGQFMIKCGDIARDFVTKVIEKDLKEVEKWRTAKFGMFTNGDQDVIVFLLHEDIRFRERASLFEYQNFNSRIDDLEENKNGVFLLHFTGPRKKKISDHKRSMKIMALGRSLIRKQQEEQFPVYRRQVLRLQRPFYLKILNKAISYLKDMIGT